MMMNKRGYPVARRAGSSAIPVAAPIAEPANPEGPERPSTPTAEFSGVAGLPDLVPAKEIFRDMCILRGGCYRVTFRPSRELFHIYHGTLRVDYAPDGLTISGDLYRFLKYPLRVARASRFAFLDAGDLREEINAPDFPLAPIRPLHIPIYPRDRYHSYLEVTDIEKSPLFSSAPCELTLTVDEYEYTQPAAGSFDGTFPSTASRTFTLDLLSAPRPAGFNSTYYEGNLYEAGFKQGTFTMGWVSPLFRKATLEIDTVTGAVAPAAVPASSGSGTEDFRTIFATAGWSLNTIYNDTSIPVPDGVDPNECCTPVGCTDLDGWSYADLHELMLDVRKSTTDLDKEWRFHLLVVPANLGCSRGVMYDQIEVHREGAVSFSDDGYPASNSSSYGSAEDERQRDVPRAFLRSAAHEVGHGFNQQHQSLTNLGEPGSDNSIMTVTPGVAGVLGGATTGDPGVFPDDIALSFNEHVRQHMIHFPDPVVRPGSMSWQAGHDASAPVPQADDDRFFLDSRQLELRLILSKTRVKLGEVLPVKWELVNRTRESITTPNNIMLEAHHAHISVTNPDGVSKPMPSFVMSADDGGFQELGAGKRLTAETNLFWSSQGFAFEVPGRHVIEVRILWNDEGIPTGVKAYQEIWVDYPITTSDNAVASLLLNDEVGKFVALGGAPHLREAVSKIDVAAKKFPRHVASKRVAVFKRRKETKQKRDSGKKIID